MDSIEQSVKLTGGPQKTTTWVKISGDGEIVVELYDFSEEAHSFLGNDVAYMLKIEAPEKKKILSRLSGEEGDESALDEKILTLFLARFSSYFEIKEWLKKNDIAYKKTFDSWA